MIKKEKMQFYFPENSMGIINEASIVKDFDTLIEMSKAGKLELTKSNNLKTQSAKLLNESLIRSIPMRQKRPVLKGFTNVFALYLMYMYSGISLARTVGKKKLLNVNPKAYEQWKEFSELEKYFYLFTIFMTSFTFDTSREEKFYYVVFNIIDSLDKKKHFTESDVPDFYFESNKFRTVFMLLDMFGFVDIKDAKPEDNKGWIIESVTPEKEAYKILTKAHELAYTIHQTTLFAEDKKPEESNTYEVKHDHTLKCFRIYADEISKVIPEFKKRITWEFKTQPGIYLFKVSLGRVWRRIAIDYRKELDDLCVTILDAFDFDFDHLYDVSFSSPFGSPLKFSGAPDISYAEYPTTADITIGRLPIDTGNEMIFTYDYGDYWEFSIVLEEIKDLPDPNSPVQESKVIQSKGKAPQQYPW